MVFFLVLNLFCKSGLCREGADRSNVKTQGRAGNSMETQNSKGSYGVYPVRFYKKVISGVDGNRCRMYPSCSRYCLDAVKKHGGFMGWIMTCDRLMRCGRDETVLGKKIGPFGRELTYDPVGNNDFWRQKHLDLKKIPGGKTHSGTDAK